MKQLKNQIFMITVLLAIVPMLVVGVISVLFANDLLYEQAMVVHRMQAQEIYGRLDDFFSSVESDLHVLANTRELRAVVRGSAESYTVQSEYFNMIYNYTLAKEEIKHIVLVRSDGSIFGTHTADIAPYPWGEDYLYQEEIFTAEAISFLAKNKVGFEAVDFKFYRSMKTDEDKTILLCLDIRDPSSYETIGKLVAHISLQNTRLLDDIKLQSQEAVRIVSPSGHVIDSTDKTEIGRKMGEENGQNSEKSWATAEDDTGNYTSRHRGEYDTSIEMSLPRKEVVKKIRSLLSLIILVIFLTGFVVVVILYIVRKRVFDKLETLTGKLTEGETTALVPIEGDWGDDEIGHLVAGYNKVTRQTSEKFREERHRLNTVKELEIRALQAQIKPHFLYNTLDICVWHAKNAGNLEIAETLIRLSRYYQVTLSSGNSLIPIGAELEHARLYLEIRQMHLGTKFSVEFQVEEGVLNYYINKITLQPLLENSIKHGIMTKSAGEESVICIFAREREDCIEISIDDDGMGMESEQMKRILEAPSPKEFEGGVGVYNVNSRIRLSYGEEYGLTYRSERGIGTSVQIKIPKITEGNSAAKASDRERSGGDSIEAGLV